MSLRPVYLSILIFFATYGASQVTSFISQKEEDLFSHIFTSEGEINVRPDLVQVTMTHSEPLSTSPTLAALSVSEPIKAFSQAASGKVRLEPLLISFLTYQNSKSIARAYSASQVAVVTLSDISKLPTFLEVGLNVGMNVIGPAEFSVSNGKRRSAELEAKKIAREQISADAELFAKQMGRKLIRCVEPNEGMGVGYGGGDPSMAGGMSMTETPDAEPVSKFIKPLTDMIIEEPFFKGDVHLAKTIMPPEVSVSATETLACEFK
jgi:hypothetical protein